MARERVKWEFTMGIWEFGNLPMPMNEAKELCTNNIYILID